MLVLAGGLTGRPVMAQGPAASALVAPDHWAWEAARRLDLLGLAPDGFDPGRSLRTRDELARLFEHALVSSAADTALAAIARGYRDRFFEEYGYLVPVAGADSAGLGPAGAEAADSLEDTVPAERAYTIAVRAGFQRIAGRDGTGVGYFPDDWRSAPVPDTGEVFGSLELSVRAGRHLSVHAEPIAGSAGVNLREADAVLVLGALGAWAGRRTVAFGPGLDGGIVLRPGVRLDGAGAFLARPIHFPWVLRALGPIQIESFLSKTYGGDRIRDPFFIAFRGSMTPHPRLTVGLNRAAMFGGRGNEPITFQNMLFLLRGGVGKSSRGDSGAFANDVLSVDLSWRVPTGTLLPVGAYLEWGMDDAAGMWHRAPGVIGGLRAARLPGAPWASLGLQGTAFARSGGTNTMWYRDFSLRQGWADYSLPVGQSLGGQGGEGLIFGAVSLLDARLQLSASAFMRDRGPQNLYAPARAGWSRGAAGRLLVRATPAAELRVSGSLEHGRGWTTGALETSLGWMH